jgi:hypothetical protein
MNEETVTVESLAVTAAQIGHMLPLPVSCTVASGTTKRDGYLYFSIKLDNEIMVAVELSLGKEAT